jgi:N6-L-threonylcarbamoyladenine synthase
MLPSKKDKPCILAIETSCDDTAVAIIKDNKILANIVSSQTIHEIHGGVIPELAGRAHLQFIVPVYEKALKTANISANEIDAIAFTQGPGLAGSLLVGCQFAKGLAMGLNIPLIGINHLQAHIAAHYLSEDKITFPFLNLLVSGGHTQIILIKDYLDYEIIGTTLDDAAGEAFDKAAKMLGLPYPGGPLIDQYAEKGNPFAYAFPISKINNYNYSFSGLKTSILYFIQKQMKLDEKFIENNIFDLAASIRHTIVKTLLITFEKAVLHYSIKDIGLAGGVSANKLLRLEFEKLAKNNQLRTHIPSFEYCTDNAAMIASIARYKYQNGIFSSLNEVPIL